MLDKLKYLTQLKSFHICMMIVIITIILFIVGMLILRYNVEGETNMPFELTKMTIISSQEGIDDGQTDSKWSLDVHQPNDVYLYIDKNEEYNKTEIIKSILIDNLKIDSTNNVNIKFYKPDAEEEKVIFKYKDEDIIENIEYTGDMESDLKNLKISNQGGIIAFRCSNNNIAKYKSNDEEINHSELLKKSNILNDNLKMNLSFNLTIKLESGKEYQSQIKAELPIDNVVEKGNTSTEITDLQNFIFKRIRN